MDNKMRTEEELEKDFKTKMDNLVQKLVTGAKENKDISITPWEIIEILHWDKWLNEYWDQEESEENYEDM